MLETTTVNVTPVDRCRVVVGACAGAGGNGGAFTINDRPISWLLLLLLAAGSTRAEPYPETSDAAGGGEAPVAGEIRGAVEEALNSGKDNATAAAAALTLLESLLASLESFLAGYGLPSASWVCAAVAVACLFLLFLDKVGIGGGSGGGSGPSKKRKGVVLFIGPCGSGKTAMCYRLSHGGGQPAAAAVTVTSMEACRYPCSTSTLVELGGGSSSVRGSSSTAAASLVDYPGHDRLRGGVGAELRTVDRVVFMLDGSALAAQVSAGTELLYDVLTDPSLEGCRGLMIALSKSDLKEAKVSRAKTLLQKELDKLRGTRGMLGMQGEEDNMPVAMTLGRPGQPFSLDVDSPCEVMVAGCSVVKEDGLDAVVEFVRASLH